MNIYRTLLYISIVICCFCVNVILFAAVVQVPSDQPTIQDGIEVVNDGDMVLVADGIYSGEGNINIDFKGKQITVKSQNGPEETIINCLGTPDTRGFIFQNKETNDTVLEGFTIKNSIHDEGGGIYFNHSSPTIKNCNIIENKGRIGIYGYNSDARIINCKISNNGQGSGVAFYGETISMEGLILRDTISKPSLISCVISENTGSGIFCFDAVVVEIKDCKVYKNSGSGIYCNFFTSARVNYCEIFQNNGGGIKCTEYASVIITDSIIKQNTAKNGGGIYCSPTSNIRVMGCIIAENIATESGGGIGVITTRGSAEIDYCTIVRNTANKRGGGVHAFIQEPFFTLSNSILWENQTNGTHPEFSGIGDIKIRSCDIQGGIDGIGQEPNVWSVVDEDNIDEDPLFINADRGDYRLRRNSPDIRMGATAPRENQGEEREDFIEDSLSVSSVGKRIIKWADLKRN